MIRKKRLSFFRDPFFHFLVLGAMLFWGYALVNDFDPRPDHHIIVDEDQVRRLAQQFQRTWMRPPTVPELRSIAEDYVKEEVLYREALALGMDQDDLVIRRRLRQKMEFLGEDLVEPQRPTDEQLQAYLDASPDKFRHPDRITLQHVYFNPASDSGDVKQKAVLLLRRLHADPTIAADPGVLGDATMLPSQLDDMTQREMANTFGAGFAREVDDLSPGVWSGPVESTYGIHLVRLNARKQGALPAMADIRPLLEREWQEARSKAANARFYEGLRARYSIDVRMPTDLTEKILAVR